MSRALYLLLPFLFATATTAAAAADDSKKSLSEPPARVGRVSVIEGRMSLRMGGEQTWTDAEVNYPVAADMEFVTDAGTRTELQLGGITLAVGGRTAVAIVALGEDATRIFLEDGSIDVRVHSLGRNERLVVETPDGSASLDDTGIYRIDASDRANPTRIVVFDGSAEVETSRGRENLAADTALEVNDEGRVRESPPETAALDEWAQTRENAVEANLSARYVSTDVPGYEDLDRAGTWQTTKDYGPVWLPSKVSSDWTPYQNGRWTWVAPWGWTWIDSASWGFAPFHYGRWITIDGHWAWTPGKRLRHPTYAPALVGFDGIDPSRFASQRQPPRRWVALGPGEIYRAPYTQDLRYLRKVNKGMLANDQLATATWDSDEWPTFINIAHVHLDRVTLPPKVAESVPAKAGEEGPTKATGEDSAKTADQAAATDSEGHAQMVLHIPMDEARRLNLVPADANVTLRKEDESAAAAEDHAHLRDHDRMAASHGQPLEHVNATERDHMTHPELADRSGLVDPLPQSDAPARPPIKQEQLETLQRTVTLPPLSRPVQPQPPARKHDMTASASTTKPHAPPQLSHETRDTPADEATTSEDETARKQN